MHTSVSSVLMLDFALLVYIYEVDIFKSMIILLFIISNMTSIYIAVDTIIILGIMPVYLTRPSPNRSLTSKL